jgi:hypothetical protein
MKFKSALAALLLISSLSIQAQTVTKITNIVVTTVTNPAPALSASNTLTLTGASNILAAAGVTVSPGLAQVGSDFLGALADAQPYFSNGIYAIEGGVMYNPSDKTGKIGGFLDLQVPVAQQASIGFGGAYLDDHWLDASISARVGTTLNWPTNLPLVGSFIGPTYAYLESGPDYDFHTHGVGSYNFAGIIKQWDISSKWKFTMGAAIGNISTLPGTDFAGGVSLTYHK